MRLPHLLALAASTLLVGACTTAPSATGPHSGGPATASGSVTSAAPGQATPAAPAVTIPAGYPTPRLHWAACEDGHHRCTSIRVPLDWRAPHGRTLTVTAAKRPADDPRQRIGTLFINPGGPGNSGVQAIDRYAEGLGATIRRRFDIVGMDPRGVGASGAAWCHATVPGTLDQAAEPPGTAELAAAWVPRDATVRAACAKGGDAVLAHMTTADVARDLEILRRAVGEEKLTFFGVSYGSYLGATYAALFPDRVRAIAVDGVLDPLGWSGTGTGAASASVPIGLRLGAGEGAHETLRAALARCDSLGAARCPGAPNLTREWDAVVRRLAQGPFVTASGEVLTWGGFFKGTLDQLYSLDTYPAMAGSLHDTFTAMAGAGAPTPTPSPVRTQASVAVDEKVEQMGVTCSDGPNPADEMEWYRAAVAQRGQASGFSDAWAWNTSLCAGWPFAGETAYRGPFDVRPAHPLLVIGNTHDPATPLSGARALAAISPGARLLVVDTFGHTSMGKSPCALAAITDYLVAGRLPAAGTTCPGAQPTFR